MIQENKLGENLSKAMCMISELKFLKDRENTNKKNKYITLDAINSKILPILNKFKLMWIIHKDIDNNFWGTIKCLEDMSSEAYCFGKIEMDFKGINKEGKAFELMNSAQAQGSNLTYARRYITSAFFNLLVDTDLDGEALELLNPEIKEEKEKKEFTDYQNKMKNRVMDCKDQDLLSFEEANKWFNIFSFCKTKEEIDRKLIDIKKLIDERKKGKELLENDVDSALKALKAKSEYLDELTAKGYLTGQECQYWLDLFNQQNTLEGIKLIDNKLDDIVLNRDITKEGFNNERNN